MRVDCSFSSTTVPGRPGVRMSFVPLLRWFGKRCTAWSREPDRFSRAPERVIFSSTPCECAKSVFAG